MSEPETWLPSPDARSAPFFEAARAGELRLQRCNGCATWLYPVRARCPECGGTDIGWAPASGRGRLYSHGLLRRAYHPRHRDRLPIVLAVVDLEEGVRISSNLIDVAPEDVRAGMRVQVAFEELPGGAAVPVFRPAT
jgi:uncharacterized OB-fold protein